MFSSKGMVRAGTVASTPSSSRSWTQLARSLSAAGIVPRLEARRYAITASTSVFGRILVAHTGRPRSLGEQPDEVLTPILADTLGDGHDDDGNHDDRRSELT